MKFTAIQEGEPLFTGSNSEKKEDCIRDVYNFFYEEENPFIENGLSFEEKESRLNGINVFIEEHEDNEYSYLNDDDL